MLKSFIRLTVTSFFILACCSTLVAQPLSSTRPIASTGRTDANRARVAGPPHDVKRVPVVQPANSLRPQTQAAAPDMTISDVTVLEGNSGNVDAVLTVSLSAPGDQLISVQYATADDTALASFDYVATSGVLAFPVGTLSQTITVPIMGDTQPEQNETFFVNLSSATGGAVIVRNQAVCTIADDDTLVLSIADGTASEANSSMSFTASLSSSATDVVTVHYSTADGTATAGTDYVASTGTLTFPVGTTSITFAVPLLPDAVYEGPSESFSVTLSAATVPIARPTGTGTITEDEPEPTLSVNDVVIAEPATGTATAMFTVSVTGSALGTTAYVHYATSDGTATAGADYVATSGTLTFPPGTTEQTIPVVVNSDAIAEGDETFLLTLSNPTNARIGDLQGTGTIGLGPAGDIRISDAVMVEGNSGSAGMVFTVELAAAKTQTVTVNYGIAPGTADGIDFAPTSGTLTFAPGSIRQFVTVPIIGDTTPEADETLTVELSSPAGATIARGTATGTILDDDLTVSVQSTMALEGDSGITPVLVTAILSYPTAQTVTVDWATEPSYYAAAGLDYTAASGTLTFPPGTTAQTLTVNVLGDLLDEPDESFLVNLSNPVNVNLGGSTGWVTIQDDDPAPSLSVNDVTVPPPAVAPATAVLTVTLSAASGNTVSVNFATANGTAVAGSDYVAAGGTLTFPPGSVTQTVGVVVNAGAGSGRTFLLDLTDPSNALLGDNQGLGTIETAPAGDLSIGDATRAEDDSGSHDMLFTVTMKAAKTSQVTVNWATSDGTATAGSDYVAASGTVTFPAGATSRTIAVAIKGDTTAEANETFTVTLSGATNAAIADAVGAGTIVDDDVSVSLSSMEVVEGNSGPATVLITATLSAPASQTVTVDWATADSYYGPPATAGADYTAASGTLTFPPGTIAQTFTVNALGDVIDEPDENFVVNLSNPVHVKVPGFPTGVTIRDDDATPSLSINDVVAPAPGSGTANAVFTVSLSGPSGYTVYVYYGTADGTAVAGSDYIAASGQLTFPPGTMTQSATVLVKAGAVTGRTFQLNLTDPGNAFLGDNQGVGTIGTPPVGDLSISDATIAEGDSGTQMMLFTVTLAAAKGSPVTVNWATADGTATAGSDYIAGSGTVTFPAGTTSRTIAVTINGDTTTEVNETFTVTLSGETNATIAHAVGTGTIADDDLSISVASVTVVEGNAGVTPVLVTATLSVPSTQTVTVDWATGNSGYYYQATAGVDYTAASGTLTFAPGTTTQTLTVNVLGDVIDEPDETFVVNLSNPVNVKLAGGTAYVTIQDDDATPSLSINDVVAPAPASGTANAVFTLSLSAPSGYTVYATYTTADVTAIAGTDYVATTGQVVFPPGTTTQTATVLVKAGAVTGRSFQLNLSYAANVFFGDNQGIATIGTPPAGELSISDATAGEGDSGTGTMLFTVTLSAAKTSSVTVNWATANGTATSGSDYVAASGVVTFPAGTTSRTVGVTIDGDATTEANETLTVTLSSAVNATIADGSATGTIADDDLTVSVAGVTVVEGDYGVTPVLMTATLSMPSAQTVTVDWATGDSYYSNPATADVDYRSAAGTLTFPPGTMTQTFTLDVLGDSFDEADESFAVNLSNPVNVKLPGTPTYVGIQDDDNTPALSINDVIVAAPATGTANAVFTVSLSEPTGNTVYVNYATADGTAMAGTDYVGATGTLTFPPGTLTQTTTVLVKAGAANGRTFQLNLTYAGGAIVGDTQGIGTIGTPPAGDLSISDATTGEGDSGPGTMLFTVTLPTAKTSEVTANWATADGTATAGSDYVAASGTVTFAAGTTSRTIAVTIEGDTTIEANETLTATLSGATNATIADGTATGTIADDDLTVSVSGVTVVEGNSGAAPILMTAMLSMPSAQTVTVDWATADSYYSDPATADVDYTAASGTLTFPPGTMTQTFTLDILGDSIDEPDENFAVNLSNPLNVKLPGNPTYVSIKDDDATPSLSVNDVIVAAPATGTANAVFTVALSAPSGNTVYVGYETADGTALAGTDYVAASGSLTFPPGTIVQTATALVNAGATPGRNFKLKLISAGNALFGDDQGIALIGAPPAGDLSIGDATLPERDSGTQTMLFTVGLRAAKTSPVSVNWATSDGTATAGSDYVGASGTVTLPAGTTSATIAVTINGDTDPEASETFSVSLSGVTNATISGAVGTGTIGDDDLSMSLDNPTVIEGNSGTTAMTVTATLSAPSTQTVTVHWATGDPYYSDPATADVDYTAASGTLTFPPGTITQTLTIDILGDSIDEPDERFVVNLSNPVNVKLPGSPTYVGIQDDDATPSISINDVIVAAPGTGTANAVFTVSLSAPSGNAVYVTYETADGTALAGTDYVAASGSLTFPPGTITQTATALVKAGAVTGRKFQLNLTYAGNAVFGDNQGIATIGTAPAGDLSISDASLPEGDADTQTMLFTVELRAAKASPVTVSWATSDGTAIAGSDYVAGSGAVTLPAGATSATIAVTINGDTDPEASETFSVSLSGATNATISGAVGTGTIGDDDLSLALDNPIVVEGNSGTTAMTVTATLSAPSTQTVTVHWATGDPYYSDPATADVDYTAASGTLTFPPGTTTQTLTINVLGDLIDEPDERFVVNLSNPVNVKLPGSPTYVGIQDDDATPSLSINDVIVAAPGTGTANAVFTVSLSAPSGNTIYVTYETADGTALAGTDYVAASGSLTFPPGTMTQTVTALVKSGAGTGRTFHLNLIYVGSALIGDNQGIATIGTPAAGDLSISDATIPEGDADTQIMLFTVDLRSAKSQPVTVNWTTVNGTATAGSDYDAAAGTLTFPAGTISKTIAVTIHGDTTVEANETFTIQLSSPTNATIARATGTGSIPDDDLSLSLASEVVSEGDTGTTAVTMTATLSDAPLQTVTVPWETADSSYSTPATAGVDYTAASGTLTFAPGTTTQTFTVNVLADTIDEPDEQIQVNLRNAVNVKLPGYPPFVTIVDDDPTPYLAIDDVIVAAPASGTANAVFTVSLSAPSGNAVYVYYETADDTAVAGTDYVTASGQLTFPPSVTTQIATVLVRAGAAAGRKFKLNLTYPGNAFLGDIEATGTIGTPPSGITISDATVVEGNSGTTGLLFTVKLPAISAQAVTVDYATADGTATAPADYGSVAGTVTFPAGATLRTITVPVVADTTDDAAEETLVVNLTNATFGATIARAQATGTILDDDAFGLSVNDVSVTEGNSGTVNATFTVSLSTPSTDTVTVYYYTADGTAVASLDYTEMPWTLLTFAPGEMSKTVTVTVNGDVLDEDNETFFVNLSSASYATIARGQGTGTIVDDDGPAISISDATVTEGSTGSVAVTLSAASPQQITVAYATANGTATAGSDYTAASGVLIFAPGDTTKSISVSTLTDAVSEGTETVLVNLSAPANATIARTQGVLQIQDRCMPPAPTISASGPTTFCAGGTVTLTASIAGATYLWSPGGETTQSIAVSSSGSYSVTVSANGCSGTSTTTVTVNPIPSAPTAGSNGHVCQGGTVNLTASTMAGATYSWTGPNGFTSTQQNPSIANATAAAAGAYSVVARVSGCPSAAATTTVVIDAVAATPVITAPASAVVNATGLIASVVQHTGSSWLWTIQSGTITSGQGTSQIVFTAGSTAGTLVLTVTETNAANCASQAGSFSVTITAAADGDANGDGVVSVGDVFYLINNLFVGGASPIGSGDANCDGQVTVADIFYLINYLFAHGPPPC